MKDSTKILIASIIIFACSIGFFIGAFAFNGCSSCAGKAATSCSKKGICEFQMGDCCKKKMDCCKKKGDCCKRHHHDGEFRRDDFHHGPHFRGEPPRDPNFKPFKDGKRFKEGKPFDKFDKKFDPAKGAAFMDSVLQVTHEQKAALEQQRKTMDSTFKAIRKQKKEAEKALREALDANDDKKIAAAKADILKAQEALLNHRIKGVKDFNKILTKEQLEKFKNFQKEHKPMPPRRDNGEQAPEQPQEL